MERRKVAQESGEQAARKSDQTPKFPAVRLPSELIHVVFTYLEPTEAAAFRWAGGVVADIGVQYLVPTAHLVLKEESYTRLLAIAEHPVVSKYVIKLVYETEGLKFADRQGFERWMNQSKPKTLSQFCSRRSYPSAGARSRQVYERGFVPLAASQKQTRQLLDRARSLYEAYRASQNKVQQPKIFLETVGEAMKKASES